MYYIVLRTILRKKRAKYRGGRRRRRPPQKLYKYYWVGGAERQLDAEIRIIEYPGIKGKEIGGGGPFILSTLFCVMPLAQEKNGHKERFFEKK